MPAIQIRCPGDYTNVTIWYPHVVKLSTTRSKLWSKYFPNLGGSDDECDAEPPTVTGSNLCDKCDEVWVRMIIWSIHHPEWVTGASLVSAMGSLKGGASFQLWPPTSSGWCHHSGPGALIRADDWFVNDDDVIVMLSSLTLGDSVTM